MSDALQKCCRSHGAPILFLVLTTALVFTPSLRHEFISQWDDSAYILANTAAHGFSGAHLARVFTSYFCGNYAPLHIISYMLDYTLWGMNPAGYILHNIVLHCTGGMLLYALLIRCAFTPLAATAATFIFLVHPVQVESVVWASQRKNVLAMVFFLASFHSYLTYRAHRSPLRCTSGYCLALLLFLCALLSKSVAIILPLALVLYDLAFAPRERAWELVKDKIPFFLVAGAAALVAMDSQTHEHGWGGRTGYPGGSPLATFATMLPVLGRYLYHLAWPARLSIFYDIPVKQGPDAATALWFVLVGALVWLGIWFYRRHRPLFFWYAFFFLALAPVAQIVPIVTLMNDRYLYFPMLGAAPLVCAVAARLWRRWRNRTGRLALGLTGALVLAALPFFTVARARVWQSPVTLWNDTVAKAPGLILFRHNLADELFHRGLLNEAVNVCNDTLSRWPDDPHALQLAGTIMTRHGEAQQGTNYLEKLVAEYPDHLEGAFALAENYLMIGANGKARTLCESILARNSASDRAKACIHDAAHGSF